MTSITKRMICANVIAILSVCVLSFTSLYVVVCAGLRANFDRTVLDKLELFVQTPELHDFLNPNLTSESREEVKTKLIQRAYLERYTAHPFGLTYLQVWDESGNELFRSPTLEEGNTLCDSKNLPTNKVPRVSNWQLPNGNQCRKYVVSVSARDGRFVGLFPGNEEQYNPTLTNDLDKSSGSLIEAPIHDHNQIVFAIARDASVLHENRRFLRNVLTILAALLVALLTGVTCAISRRSMAPLRQMAKKIELLDDSNLQERIELPVFTELVPIQEKLNGYLRRIEAAFQRERGFSHDVAHEFRTPLSALKMQLGYGKQKPRNHDQYGQLLNECLEVTDHLDQLVHRMLYLVQLESGQYKLEIDNVEVSELLQSTWATIQGENLQNCQVSFDLDFNCKIRTELILLHQLLINVLSNARQYVNDGGLIEICCRRCFIGERTANCKRVKDVAHRNEAVEIEIVNSGSTITDSQAKLVFDRFWRGCNSRSIGDSHTGLGLTIADRIATALSGNIAARSENGKFAIFIWLPKQIVTKST